MKSLLALLVALPLWSQVPSVPNSDFPTFRTNLNNSLAKAANITSSYSNPSWITSLAYIKITGVPTFVPVGGSANQVLSKVDGTDYNTYWRTITAGTIPSVSNLLKGDGAGNASDSGILPADVATLSNSQTFTGDKISTGVVDHRGASHSLPFRTGLLANIPATCTIGEKYFATNATAGQNDYNCTSANIWTQGAGGGGGTPAGTTGQTQYNNAGSFGAFSSGLTSVISGATQFQSPEFCVSYSSTVVTDFGGQAANFYQLKIATFPAYWSPRSFRIEETTTITTSGTTGGAAVTALAASIGSLASPYGYKPAFPLMAASSPAYSESSGGATYATSVNGSQDVYLQIINTSVNPAGFLSNITGGIVKVRICGVTLQ